MPKYQQLRDPISGDISKTMILRIDDGAMIPFDPLNIDYIAYKVWEDAGGQPMPMPTLVDAVLTTAAATASVSAKVG